MSVVRVEEAAAEARAPARAARKPGAAWSQPAQLRRSFPIIRLLATIWSIPQVSKVGLQADGAGIIVHVLLSEDDRSASATVYAAERDYLNATSLHSFELRVTPLSRVPDGIRSGILAGFETVLER